MYQPQHPLRQHLLPWYKQPLLPWPHLHLLHQRCLPLLRL